MFISSVHKMLNKPIYVIQVEQLMYTYLND